MPEDCSFYTEGNASTLNLIYVWHLKGDIKVIMAAYRSQLIFGDRSLWPRHSCRNSTWWKTVRLPLHVFFCQCTIHVHVLYSSLVMHTFLTCVWPNFCADCAYRIWVSRFRWSVTSTRHIEWHKNLNRYEIWPVDVRNTSRRLTCTNDLWWDASSTDCTHILVLRYATFIIFRLSIDDKALVLTKSETDR